MYIGIIHTCLGDGRDSCLCFMLILIFLLQFSHLTYNRKYRDAKNSLHLADNLKVYIRNTLSFRCKC
jgi:hypothetical protein